MKRGNCPASCEDCAVAIVAADENAIAVWQRSDVFGESEPYAGGNRVADIRAQPLGLPAVDTDLFGAANLCKDRRRVADAQLHPLSVLWLTVKAAS
jgi:hypothetical protein